MPLQLLQFNAGVVKDITEYTAGKNGPFWVDSNLVRFQDGLPAKVGGWAKEQTFGRKVDGSPSSVEELPKGVGRKMLFWRALSDGKDRIVLGTHSHLYIIQDGALYDITPLRKTTNNLSNPLATTNGSTTVTITDNSHGAKTGDFVVLESATATGGIAADDLNRMSGYQITLVDSNSYTITVDSAATSTVSSGGGTSLDVLYLKGLDHGLGTQSASPALGWGIGTWGRDGWGDPATVSSTTVVLENSSWHINLWGEDVLAGIRNDGLYYWDTSGGPASRAVLISSLGGASDVPTEARTAIVSFPDRHYVCGGCNTLGSSTMDEMLVRWSTQEDYTVWTPKATNTSGDQRLQVGSKIISMISTREETLISTDEAIYGMTFVGGDFVFSFRLLSVGSASAGLNSMVNVDSVVYWMGTDNFYIYDGSVKELPCAVQQYVFNRIDPVYKDKVTTGHNKKFKEISWFYPSRNRRYRIVLANPNFFLCATPGDIPTLIPQKNLLSSENCGITWPFPGTREWRVGDQIWISTSIGSANQNTTSVFSSFSKNNMGARAFITKVIDQNNLEVELDPIDYITKSFSSIAPTDKWYNIRKQAYDTFMAGFASFLGESTTGWFETSSIISSVTELTDTANPENDSYVTYNYEQKIWTVGNMGRSVWLDSFGARKTPFAFESDGVLYNHEVGNSADGDPMNCFIESSPQELTADGNDVQMIDRVIPDVRISENTTLEVFLKTNKYPFSLPTPNGVKTGDVSIKGPLSISYANTGDFTSIDKISTRARGRQVSLKIQSIGVDDQWAIGTFRINTRQDGLR